MHNRLYVRSGETWTQQEKLTANDGAADDRFGISVSLDGDTALIGADCDDDKADSSGSAYVFVRSGTTWTQQAKLTAYDGAYTDYFGFAVSVSGDTALIGALADDNEGDNASGSAYVFVRSGTTWTLQAKITASDSVYADYFGYRVSLDGDTALIGAEGDDDKADRSGAAYVFVRSGTTWTQQAKLTPSDGVANSNFSHSLSLDGDTAFIGAIGDDDKGDWSGSVYVFVRSQDGIWTQQAKLIANDGMAGDQFGSSVSVSGDTALVGATCGRSSAQGYAYIFVRSQDGTWTQQAKLAAADATADYWFGVSVSLDSGLALIGACGDDSKSNNAGAAYTYDLHTPESSSYTVTPSAGTGGSISPDSPQTVNQGATTSFTILADSDYKIKNVEGCGGTLSGNTYTTASVTADCAVTASFMSHPSRNGMTWGVSTYNSSLDITRVHCFGQPKPEGQTGCNPYQGDTSCSAALPVLCVKVDGRPRPAYALATCSSCAMPDEYYNGWAEGSIGLTAPAQGNAFATLADADAYCAAQLGEGYQVAEHHTGRYVMGMDENNFYGDTWPQNTYAGGWGFYGPGQLANNSRFWVDINDQDANCWGRAAATAKSLSVNSSGAVGADGVAIAVEPSEYSGTTNYTQTGIPAGTSITLTAPAAGSEITAFSSWEGCDSTDAEARTCTVMMSEDKTVTAIFVINSYTVTPSAGTGGSISPNTPQSVNSYATFDFTVTPSTGYVIDTVEGCGGGTLNGDTYTTAAINADCAVTASFKLNDSDRDGVVDSADQCPNTASGTVVDRTGCSISQLVPCQGPKGTTAAWKNKGQYVSSVAKSAESFLAAGLITSAEKNAIVSAAATSGCGGKK